MKVWQGEIVIISKFIMCLVHFLHEYNALVFTLPVAVRYVVFQKAGAV